MMRPGAVLLNSAPSGARLDSAYPIFGTIVSVITIDGPVTMIITTSRGRLSVSPCRNNITVKIDRSTLAITEA